MSFLILRFLRGYNHFLEILMIKHRAIILMVLLLSAAILPLANFGSPFDPPFIVKVDELCANGDLALSIPLLRVRLDGKTSLNVRAEHFLETADYGHARSAIVLRPLSTTLAPHDRDAVLWRKPNGERIVLRKSAGTLPKGVSDEARAFLDFVKTYRAYESRGVTAWLAGDSLSWGIVYSEGITFGYEDGGLAWLNLPSGTKVWAKSDGAVIRELRTDDDVLFSFERVSDIEARISAGRQYLNIHYDRGRIVEIVRLPAKKLVQFEYTPDGLLLAATHGGRRRHYAWAKTKRSLPPIINWVNPWYLQSADGRRFDYFVDNNSIVMSAISDDKPRKTTSLRVRYGAVISVRERRN
jgi:hypothetical protein